MMEQQRHPDWARLGLAGCRRCGGTERAHGRRGLCRPCFWCVQRSYGGNLDATPYPRLERVSAAPPARPPEDPQAAARAYAALQHLDGARARRAYALMRAVCRAEGLPIAAVLGPCREDAYVRPRRVMAYLLMTDAGLTSTQVERVMGRDHSTILHHRARARALLERGDGWTVALVRDVRAAAVVS